LKQKKETHLEKRTRRKTRTIWSAWYKAI